MGTFSLGLGSPVWKLSPEVCHYEKDAKGRSVGGPLRRPQWVEWVVQGETSRSWVVAPRGIPGESVARLGRKIPKSATPEQARELGFALTPQQIEDDVWQHYHRPAVIQTLLRADAATLRRVAELIGYTGEGVKGE